MQRTPPPTSASKKQPFLSRALPPPQPIPRSSPSTAPAHVAVASLEQHVERLVAQVHRLQTQRDNAIAEAESLKSQLGENEGEVTRKDENLLLIRERYKAETSEWKKMHHVTQFVHNVARLKVSLALNEERMKRWEEKEELTKHLMGAVVRDFNLVRFKTREIELMNDIARLEADMEEERILAEEAVQNRIWEHEQELFQHQAILDEAQRTIEQLEDDISANAATKAKIEDELAKLKKEQTALSKTHSTQTRHLSTITAELTASKAKVDELEGTIQSLSADMDLRESELTRLKQSDERDSAETAELMDAKVALELKIKKMEKQLKDVQRQAETDQAELKIERKKASRMENEINAVKDQLAEAQQELEAAGQATEDAAGQIPQYRKEIADLKRKVNELKQLSKAEKVVAQPEPVPVAKKAAVKQAVKRIKPRSPTPSEDEDEEVETQLDTTKPSARNRAATPDEDDDEEQEDFTEAIKKVTKRPAPKAQPAQSNPRGKKPPPIQEEDDGSDEDLIELEPVPVTRSPPPPPAPKAKPKPKPKPKAQQLAVPTEDDVEEESVPGPSKAKGKRKAPSEEPPRPVSKSSKTVSRQGSAAPPKKKPVPAAVVEEADEEDDAVPQPKKKRKLGGVLGGGGGGASKGWSWDAGGTGGEDIFSIPVDLSPVKGGVKPIPARSSFAPPKGLFGR